jgi:hypothetical protein
MFTLFSDLYYLIVDPHFFCRRPQGAIDDPGSYHIYTGRKGEKDRKSAYQYDNRAFESQDPSYYNGANHKDPPYW